jgi:hypothetical protein
MPERRVYYVAGSAWIHNEVTPHLEALHHTVVHRDAPGEAALSGLEEALEKKADAAVIFMGKEEECEDGRTGEDVVREMSTRAPGMSIFSFSREESPIVPGVDRHRKRTADKGSYMELASDIFKAAPGNRYL